MALAVISVCGDCSAFYNEVCPAGCTKYFVCQLGGHLILGDLSLITWTYLKIDDDNDHSANERHYDTAGRAIVAL